MQELSTPRWFITIRRSKVGVLVVGLARRGRRVEVRHRRRILDMRLRKVRGLLRHRWLRVNKCLGGWRCGRIFIVDTIIIGGGFDASRISSAVLPCVETRGRVV